MRLRCGSLSFITPVLLLANGLDVRSVLHGQASLTAVIKICVNQVAMNGCKKSKDSLKDCFENFNIKAEGSRTGPGSPDSHCPKHINSEV